MVGLSTNTIRSYRDQIEVWIKFCKDFDYDPLSTNEQFVYEFFGFLAKEMNKTGDTIDNYLCALAAYWRFYNINYKRSNLMTYTIVSLKLKFPVDPQPKNHLNIFIW